jgi:TatD DNase family protein
MQLVDSHCHIDFPQLGPEVGEVLDRARAAGVAHLLCVSVNLEDFPGILDLARRHPGVYASCGVHPNTLDGREPGVEELVTLGSDPAVVAIGETGLDYYRSEGDLDWQRERFRVHIAAARRLSKPLIIHTRAAADDTLSMLQNEKASEIGGVMHCFSESWEVAKQALDLGFYISFSGIVTFRSADTLRDVARRVPADRLLVETDAPYLAPVPHRGKTNEPAYVRHVAECVAELRSLDPVALAELSTANFFRLFRKADRDWRQAAA